jgi:hypothetical protein
MDKLRAQFALIEMAIFPEWLKADDKRREEIAKELGQMEAKMTIAEIEKEVALRYERKPS